MSFVQLIHFQTSKMDEIRKMAEEWGDDASTALRSGVYADRDNPNSYMVIVEFPDYDTAMANSNRPETSEFSQKFAALCDGPPSFTNLDLVQQLR